MPETRPSFKNSAVGKARRVKPFAVLFPGLDSLRLQAKVSARAAEELASVAAPIVLLPKLNDFNLAAAVCPDTDHLGAMLPSTPLLAMIAADFGGPLVATSANFSGEPILGDGQEPLLTQLADDVLQHDLAIIHPQDDSLVRFTQRKHRRIILRRGRGLAPSIYPPAGQPTGADLLACGADLKGVIAVRSGGKTYLSPYLGDLADYRTQSRYQRYQRQLIQLTGCRVGRVLTDAHPGYTATQIGSEYAESSGAKLTPVQHHEAHFAALLGEHSISGRAAGDVLGVIWDGTGYGSDGNIWGGEFLRYAENHFERVNHLSYFPHLGGDNMATDPRYAALALFGDQGTATKRLRSLFDPAIFHNLLHLRAGARLYTSSVGRVFDAVACLLGICDEQAYEGQAAARLESAARRAILHDSTLTGYGLDNWLTELAEEATWQAPETVAARFHLTLVDWIGRVAAEQAVTQIGFSGGCWQNALLVDLADERLGGRYTLLFHEQLSPNDENIAYGQVMHHFLTAPTINHEIQERHVSSYPG